MKQRVAEFDRRGLSAEERRRAIVRAHRMYKAEADPYCYPGTTVLINRLDLRDQAELSPFEAEITSQRAAEPLPAGRLGYRHYCAIHRHLFQDVYP
jgi:cell filamentation protein